MSGPTNRLTHLAAHLSPQSNEETKQQTRLPPYLHTLSPTAFLPRAAEIEPDAEAIFHITTNNKTIRRTYHTFANRARGIAQFFRKHSLRRVGILCPNTPAFLESLFGIAAAGSVSVAINYRLKPEDICYIFQHAEVDSIIVDSEYVDLLDLFRKANPHVVIIVDDDTDASPVVELAAGGDRRDRFVARIAEGWEYADKIGSKGWTDLDVQTDHENDLISLAYTSGTTARPKGVEFTHRGVYLASIANVIESNLNHPQGQCRYLWTLPLFHATGWTFPWAVTAVRGTHICLRKINYPLIWKLLKNERVTNFSAAPTVNTLLCADLAAVKLEQPVRVTVAGSAPTAHLFETMTGLNLCPVHVYGLTESYGPLTKAYNLPHWDHLPHDEKFAKMARQGHGFITSLAARVIKPFSDDNASNLDPSIVHPVTKDGKEIGEIVFQGNICAKGYYKDEVATRKLFAGGVLHTGDLAVWHSDGSIQILDRSKDIIISGGENISSLSLEGMLVKHPDVLEAGVIAVPDKTWGETPKAYVTVRSGREGVKGADIILWAKTKSNISKFMIPREIVVVTELPKTATGKIQKNVLREWSREGTPADKLSS